MLLERNEMQSKLDLVAVANNEQVYNMTKNTNTVE